MRLKTPAQPLIFCFFGVSGLMGAAADLYREMPDTRATLCINNERYFMAVYCSLLDRKRVSCLLSEYGIFICPGRVIYACFEEHGKKLSDNIIKELGALLER